MRQFPVLLVIGFSVLTYFGCNGGSDDSADDGDNASGQQSSENGNRSPAGNSSGPQRGGDNADVDIVGEYRYGSELLGGGTESGTVRIQRLGDAYDVLMSPARGNEYYGIGIRTGDHFAVCYSYPAAGERGVGSFVINADGTLTGHWATLGTDGELLADTWVKQ